MDGRLDVLPAELSATNSRVRSRILVHSKLHRIGLEDFIADSDHTRPAQVGRLEDANSQRSDALTPGAVFNDAYRIERSIGRGGMAEVFEATRLSDGQRLALKLMHGGALWNDELRKRFLREAELIAQFHHPNIVRFYEYGQVAGKLFIAMEYIEGLPLSDLLEDTRLAPAFALEVADQVCSALEEPHASEIVHRDLKPANIHLSRGPDGHLLVKLLDFGVAHVEPLDLTQRDQLDEDTVDPATVEALTRVGTVIGTPEYMAPEQAKGLPITRAADCYALGAVTYRCITGVLPFDGDSPFALLVAKLHGVVVPPSQRLPGLPAELDQLVAHLMALEPRDRPADASGARAAIRDVRRTLGFHEGFALPQGPLREALRQSAHTTLDDALVDAVQQVPHRERKPSWVVITGERDAPNIPSKEDSREPAPSRPPAATKQGSDARRRQVTFIAAGVTIGAALLAAILTAIL